MKTKKELRKEILSLRREMPAEEVERLSAMICENVKKQKEYKEAEKICLYMPINNEADASMLAEPAREDGKEVYIPKVTGDVMVFNLYDPEGAMHEGAFHIQESESDVILDTEDRVLIIMPGSVFDRSCGRIGYGGGYYDKYLAAHPGCKTAAICYSFQIIDGKLPSEEHDIDPDMVVCENEVIRREDQ